MRGGDGLTMAVGFCAACDFRYGGISSILIGRDATRNDALVDGLPTDIKFSLEQNSKFGIPNLFHFFTHIQYNRK